VGAFALGFAFQTREIGRMSKAKRTCRGWRATDENDRKLLFELETITRPSLPELPGIVSVDQVQSELALAVQPPAQRQLTHQSSKCDR